jgi:N4-gp56 family major capsid protein
MAMNTATATGAGLTPLSGVLQTVYSQEVLLAAQPLLKFDQFAVVKTELNVSPGMTIQFLGYDNIPLGGKLTEGTQMTTKTLATNTRQITVYEYGNAIATSEFLLQTSFRDVMADAAVLLGRDFATVVDSEERAVLETTTQKVFAGRKANHQSLVAADILDVRAIKDAVEVLSTKNIPKVNGDFYVCFVHPHQSRNLRDDANWITAAQYGDPDRIFNGEIGRIEDVVFIETTDLTVIPMNTGPAVQNTNVDTYKAILFGAEAFAKAVALPVEMRDNGIIDFGREHALAWYSIMGFGTLRDNTTVVIETA